MRTIMYFNEPGKFDVLVIPDSRQRLPPVLLQGLTNENVKSELAKVYAAVKGEAPPDGPRPA